MKLVLWGEKALNPKVKRPREESTPSNISSEWKLPGTHHG